MTPNLTQNLTRPTLMIQKQRTYRPPPPMTNRYQKQPWTSRPQTPRAQSPAQRYQAPKPPAQTQYKYLARTQAAAAYQKQVQASRAKAYWAKQAKPVTPAVNRQAASRKITNGSAKAQVPKPRAQTAANARAQAKGSVHVSPKANKISDDEEAERELAHELALLSLGR